MRKLFWILLLGNVVLFAAMQLGWMGWGDQEPQAQPALNPDKIRLLESAQNVPAKNPPASAQLNMPASAPVQVRAAHAPAPALAPGQAGALSKAVQPRNAQACMEWGEFSGPDLARAAAALSGMQSGAKLSRHQVERDIGYWVYISPLKSRASANRKVAELKALGVSEYFIVLAAGPWHNAISLGVFKTRDAAQNYLNYLRTRGVHTAKVGARVSKVKETIFKLGMVDAVTAAKLTAMQNDFPGSELKEVPCALTR